MLRSAALVLALSLGSSAVPAAQSRVSFTQVVVGLANTCALAADGQAWCWGDNAYGQLGDGTKKNRFVPAPVSGGLAFTELIVNGSDTAKTLGLFACGLAADGAAHCWGNNDIGQLGDGTTTDRLVPTRVMAGSPFTTLGAGAATVCGIARDGQLFCWGAVGSPALALRSGRVSVSVTKQPIQIPLPGSTKAARFIADGSGDPCVVAEDGAAYCWTESQGRMIVASLTPPGHTFQTVALGLLRKCGLTTEGALRCWMQRSGSMELSLAAMSGRNPPPPGVEMLFEQLLPDMRFDQLLREYDLCALSRDGQALCVSGEDLNDSRKPVVPQRAAAPLLFKRLWMTLTRRCGLTADGELHCWPADKPAARVGDGLTFSSMSTGGSGSNCAVATDGRVFCWGENRAGQLGDGTREPRSTPVPIKLP
jgi:hypothetical protein